MNRRSTSLGCLVTLFCLVPVSTLAQQTTGGLRGRVVDRSSLDPIDLGRVTLVDTEWARWTRTDGLFVFEALEPGTYTVHVAHSSYEEITRDSVRVTAGATVELELQLEPRAVPLDQIVVTPGAFSFMETGGATRQTMSREDIESVPQLGDDVFRAVNRLPGLSSGDYSAHFSIRGGHHDETLILLDGLQLYEPYHLKDFDEGAISIIDTETIQGVELMTGGFPAQYGNKRSGVFNISSRVPDMDRTRYSVGVSFLNARAMAMGPLGSKGSWLASARSGYMDLVFNIIGQDELPSPRYHDIFAKLRYDLSAKHWLSLDLLHAGDKYTFDAASTSGFRDTLDTQEVASNSYGNSYAWATLHSTLGLHTTVRTILSAGVVTRDRDGTEFVVDTGEAFYDITNHRDFYNFGILQDWAHDVTDEYILSYGFDYRRQRSTDDFHNIVDQDPNDVSPDPEGHFPVETITSNEASGNLVAVYLSNRWRPVRPLILEVGGRYDHASWTGDDDFSVRTSASLGVGKGRTLRLAWGQYRQVHGIDDVSALDSMQTYFPSELTKQWTLGVEQVFSNGALLRLEGYYKDGSNLRPRYRNWKGGIDTFPETNEDRILAYAEANTTTGFEAYFDHRFGERIKARASYSLSFAEEDLSRVDNINGSDPLEFDPTHDIPMDQRHAFNADCTYRLAQRWSLNASFAFHSGWPVTLEELIPLDEPPGEATVRPQKLWAERLPHYHRLDVRATRRWSTARGDWRLFLELVNLTNHANIFGYDYQKALGSNGEFVLARDEEQWFTILPSVGVSWSSSF